MKVAITHTRYAPEGRLERSVHELVRRLLDAGHEVHVFCHDWVEEAADARALLHRIPDTWKSIRFLEAWSFDRWVRRRVRREAFDVVHGFARSSSQDVYTMSAACFLELEEEERIEAAAERRGGAKRKRHRKGTSRGLERRQAQAIRRRRFSPGNFHRVITESERAAAWIRRRYGLPEDAVVAIPPGVDADRFHPRNREQQRESFRERLVTPLNAFVVAVVADDYVRSRVPALIEAARITGEAGGLPLGQPLRIAVIGRDSHEREKEMVELARAKGVWQQVKFYGSQERLEPWLGMADAVACPARFDPFGAGVLEGLATGLPALVSAEVGAAEAIEDGVNGFVLADPDDARALAARLAALAGDPALWTRLAEAARATVAGRTWEGHYARVLELYAQVVASKRQARPELAERRR